ncbi:MAG: SDR family oxidoreductase [Nitratireductor sp.]|nr:SDR family oxidoreductase [Nitratireductor sp.]
MKEFADKAVIVTGGSRGIGAEIARAFAAVGARVAIVYRSGKEAAENLCSEIAAAGGDAVAVQADISKPLDAKQAVEKAAKQFSKIDILINAAGIGPYLPLAGITEEHYRDIFDTNVLGTVMMIQAAVPHMPEEGGRIVNFASRLAYNPLPGSSIYSASKAAVVCLTHTYARELGAKNITVNAIAPGVIETDMTRDIIAQRGEGIIAQTPLHRIGQPDDIAGVALFLASSASKWITGRTLIADGGLN